MSLKKVWVYLAVLMAVAAAFFVSEYVVPRPSPEGGATPIFDLTPEGIQKISWQRGETVIELMKNKGWELVHPLSTPADPEAVAGVLQSLSGLKAERKFQPDGKGLSEFGLDRPEIIIRFTAQEKKLELHLGAKTVAGQAQYIKASHRPEIFLVEAFAAKELDRDILALRQKKVFYLTPDQVEGLEIEVGKKQLILEKSSQGWLEKGHPEKPLSKSRVESLLMDLTRVKAKEFLEGEQESAGWGLKEPAYRIRLKAGGKDKKEEGLWIGAEAGGKGFYARCSLYPAGLVIEGDILKRLPADLTGWEDKPNAEKKSGLPEVKKGP